MIRSPALRPVNALTPKEVMPRWCLTGRDGHRPSSTSSISSRRVTAKRVMVPRLVPPHRAVGSRQTVSRVKVSVMSDASAPSLVLAVLPSFSAAAGLLEDDGQKLRTVVEGLLGFALDNAYPDGEPGEVDVTLEAGEGLVQVTVHDWGRPLMSRGGAFGPLPERLAAVAGDARSVQLLNLGGGGKRLTAEVPVSSSTGAQVAHQHAEGAPR